MLFFLEERFFFFEPIRTVKATTRFLERNGVYHLQTQQLVYAKFSLNQFYSYKKLHTCCHKDIQSWVFIWLAMLTVFMIYLPTKNILGLSHGLSRFAIPLGRKIEVGIEPSCAKYSHNMLVVTADIWIRSFHISSAVMAHLIHDASLR